MRSRVFVRSNIGISINYLAQTGIVNTSHSFQNCTFVANVGGNSNSLAAQRGSSSGAGAVSIVLRTTSTAAVTAWNTFSFASSSFINNTGLQFMSGCLEEYFLKYLKADRCAA